MAVTSSANQRDRPAPTCASTPETRASSTFTGSVYPSDERTNETRSSAHRTKPSSIAHGRGRPGEAVLRAPARPGVQRRPPTRGAASGCRGRPPRRRRARRAPAPARSDRRSRRGPTSVVSRRRRGAPWAETSSHAASAGRARAVALGRDEGLDGERVADPLPRADRDARLEPPRAQRRAPVVVPRQTSRSPRPARRAPSAIPSAPRRPRAAPRRARPRDPRGAPRGRARSRGSR